MSTSTSAPQPPKLLAGGRATITGLVILANPRLLPASKTLVFDAQFYLGSMDQFMGSLRYFNSDNSIFDEEPSLYFAHTSFARRELGADVPVSGNRTHLDYFFVGDIEWCISAGKPGQRYLLETLHQDNASGSQTHPDLNDLPTIMIDPCRKPFIQVTGVAMELSKEKATFEVTVEQYISYFRFNPSTPQGGTHLKPTTTFFCYIPDLPKFRTSKKPLPGNKRFVSISGFLTGMDTSGDGSKVEQFRIEVRNITFCGQYIPPAHTMPSPQSSPVKTPGRASTALFAYDLRTPPCESPSAPP